VNQVTQTQNHANLRWKNTEGRYSVRHPELVDGNHVMLIDDVITTGATLLHCVEALTQSVNDIKVSACAIAATKLD
ncbi:MAG: ComF family protein, partial [Muribaculaceae bacterium]|nr:ComF family protein [Muribaculaceae bacterium]